MSSPSRSLFFFGGGQFPLKIVPCRFSLDLPLCGLQPHRKAGGGGSNLWLSANGFALFHWTLDLQPSCKVALIDVL